jgi:hypothetical protein
MRRAAVANSAKVNRPRDRLRLLASAPGKASAQPTGASRRRFGVAPRPLETLQLRRGCSYGGGLRCTSQGDGDAQVETVP